MILFVCYSENITCPDYDNAMHALIKRTYVMAIVPSSLPSGSRIRIHTWLSIFMSEIMNRLYVIDSSFCANIGGGTTIHISEVYVCRHIVGNPFLQISDRLRWEIDNEEVE